MRNPISSNWPCYAGALFAGLVLATALPHEPTFATTSDRDSKFMMMTVPLASKTDRSDAVFVVDLISLQLKGAILNRTTGKFEGFFFRDVGKDLPLGGGDEPRLCAVNGISQDVDANPTGAIYIGDYASGLIVAYAFPSVEKRVGAAGATELMKLDSFSWQVPLK